MFCDGICSKKNKNCGLLAEYTVEKNGEISTVRKCVLHASFDSMLRQEQAGIRIQAAIEHSRNQQNADELETQKAVAHGFIGLIHTFQQNPEAVKQAGISKLKLMKLVEMTEKKQGQIAEDQIKIASGGNK